MTGKMNLAVLAATVALAATPCLATSVRPSPPVIEPPYSVGEVLPCLDQAERDLCLLRMFMREKGEPWLRKWFEVYADPDLAGSIGINVDTPAATGGVDPDEVLREVLSLDRHGAAPVEALKPFDQLIKTEYGERYRGLEVLQLLVLVEMGREPAFPLRRRPSPALVKAAEARMRTALAEEPAILRPDDADPYIRLLVRWGDKAGAEEIDALAWRGNDEHPTDEKEMRIGRLARLGHLDEAATAALSLKRDLTMDRMDDFAVVQARETVLWEAERQDRKDIALAMARRLLEEACSDRFQLHPPVFQFRDVLKEIVHLADSAEAAQWAERVEARSISGPESGRLDAAVAAFRAWRTLGHPERAHRILEAWRSRSSEGSAEYDFEPKGAVASMLLAEGRVDEAWALSPDAKALFRLNGSAANIDRILANVGASDRFAALAQCADSHPLDNDAPQCVDRLEAAAATPAQKVEAAELALGSLWPNTSNDYGPYAYGVPPDRKLIESRFAMVARLLHAATAVDPSVLRTPLQASSLRQAVRLSLDSTLIAERRPTAGTSPAR